jgi:hypothetical protein
LQGSRFLILDFVYLSVVKRQDLGFWVAEQNWRMVRDDELRATMKAGVKTASAVEIADRRRIRRFFIESIRVQDRVERGNRFQQSRLSSTVFTSEEAGARLQSDFIQTAMAGTLEGIALAIPNRLWQDGNFLQQETSPRG